MNAGHAILILAMAPGCARDMAGLRGDAPAKKKGDQAPRPDFGGLEDHEDVSVVPGTNEVIIVTPSTDARGSLALFTGDSEATLVHFEAAAGTLRVALGPAVGKAPALREVTVRFDGRALSVAGLDNELATMLPGAVRRIGLREDSGRLRLRGETSCAEQRGSICPTGTYLSGIADEAEPFGPFDTLTCCALRPSPLGGARWSVALATGARSDCAGGVAVGVTFGASGIPASIECQAAARRVDAPEVKPFFARGRTACGANGPATGIGDELAPDATPDQLVCGAWAWSNAVTAD